MNRAFWVNVNSSYKEVIGGKFLWAPKIGLRKDGKTYKRAGWEQLKKVTPGDIIFMHHKQHVVGIATAQSSMYDSEVPETRKPNNPDYIGNKIDVTLFLLTSPVSTAQFKDRFILDFNAQCTPRLFNKNKQVTQAYLYDLPIAAAYYLADALEPQFPLASRTALESED